MTNETIILVDRVPITVIRNAAGGVVSITLGPVGPIENQATYTLRVRPETARQIADEIKTELLRYNEW